MKIVIFAFFWLMRQCCFLQAVNVPSPRDETLTIDRSLNVIKGEWIEQQPDLIIPGDQNIELRREFQSTDRHVHAIAKGWYFNIPDFFHAEIPRRKCLFPPLLVPHYEYDRDHRLTKIEWLHPKLQSIVAWISITYENPTSCKVAASTGEWIQYQLSTSVEGDRLLSQVLHSNGKIITYKYQPHPTERKYLISERMESGGDWLKFIYYEMTKGVNDPLRDYRTGKIKAVLKSKDEGKTYSLICQLEYEPGKTSLINNEGALIKYHFNEKNQVVKLETFISETKTSPYKIEAMDWCGNQLLSKEIKDCHQDTFVKEKWDYSIEGNLLKYIIEGQLTSNLAKNETYTTHYKYHENNICEEQEDNGKIIRYLYENNRLKASFIFNHNECVERNFFAYHDDGRLFTSYKDNGSELEFENLTNVTHCYFESNLSYHPLGMPQEIEKGYIDLASHTKITCEKHHFQYDGYSRLISHRIFNSKNEVIEIELHDYDNYGRIYHSHINGIEIFYFYDAFGHLIHKQKIAHNQESNFFYSPAGPLLKENEINDGNLIKEKSYQYNVNGLLEKTTDLGGNETFYSYDALGRKILEIHPLVFDQNHQVYHPHYKYRYDALNRVVQLEEPGKSIKFSYNSRSLLTLKEFSNGSIESKTYSLDGSIKSSKEINQVTFLYDHDAVGRKQKKIQLNPNGSIHSSLNFQYHGFLIDSESFSNGITIENSYNQMGKLSIKKGSNGRKESFIYDTDGSLINRLEWVDENQYIEIQNSSSPLPPKVEIKQKYITNLLGQNVLQKEFIQDNYTHLIVEHDALERPTLYKKYSEFGQLLDQWEILYDKNNNKTAETHWKVKKGQCESAITTVWHFNEKNQLETIIEAFNTPNQRSTFFCYDALGQLITKIKPDGVILSHIYNENGKLIEIFSSDKTVHYKISYDILGYPSCCENQITHKSTLQKYSVEGQVLEETFENGYSISHEYDLLGRQKKIILPDHSTIEYLFEGKHLKEIKRMDQTGNEKYHHGFCWHNDLLIKENLPHNLSEIIYDYHEGKLTQILLPEIKFTREHCQNQIIEKCNNNIEHIYTFNELHQIVREQGQFQNDFDIDNLNNIYRENGQFNELNEIIADDIEYDLNGNLIRNGNFTYFYDAFDRLIKIYQNETLLEQYSYDLWHRRISSLTHDFIYDGNTEIGAYDSSNQIHQLRILAPLHPFNNDYAIAIELKEYVFSCFHDLKGSIGGLISHETRKIEERYHYSAYGTPLAPSLVGNPWLFAGKRYNETTGLIHFNRREYIPTLGRWLTCDPAKSTEGPNLYAFTQNNPIELSDLYGLKAVANPWNQFKNWFQNIFEKLGNAFIDKCKEAGRLYGMKAEQCFNQIVGENFLMLLGYYTTDSEVGVFGQGEVSDKVRVSFINGILTNYPSLVDTLNSLSDCHGGVNIHYVYRPTKGWAWDLLRSFLVKFGYVSAEAHNLANEWKKMIEQMGGVNGGGKIIHYAHSIGTIETLRALSLLTEEEQKMIEVYAFGSPSIGRNDPHLNVYYYVSVRDGVCLLDLPAFIEASLGKMPNVTFMGTFLGLPLVDHYFTTQTYQDLWKAMGRTFTDWYGTLIR